MNSKHAKRSVFRNIFLWAFASIVAIALLEFNPFVGLAAAVIGGIVFGLWLFK